MFDRCDRILEWLKKSTSKAAGAFVWLAAAGGIAAFRWIPISRGVRLDAVADPYLADTLLEPLLSLGAFVVVVSLIRNVRYDEGIVSKILGPFGLYSYGIYYLHPVFLILSSLAIRHSFGMGPDRPGFYVLLIILVPLLTWQAVRFLAKLPFGKYLT